jgi:hypothetical protein
VTGFTIHGLAVSGLAVNGLAVNAWTTKQVYKTVKLEQQI